MAHNRAAAQHLNYPGDVSNIDRSRPLGPNTLGEHLWPVSAEYDAETDRTRVGLSYVAPEAGDEKPKGA